MMEPINYKLELFEGPLELLLSLVIKHKMKIEDIPIDLLCDQYMAYMDEAAGQNIELACEFLTMASELMLIKSRMLLPRTPGAAEDPRTPLVNTILEYQKAKLAAAHLSDLFAEYGSRMVKEQDDVSPDKTYVAPHHVELLHAAMMHVLTEARELADNSGREKVENLVNVSQIPLRNVIGGLIDRLKREDVLFLDGCFTRDDSKLTLIAKFIGILELLKSHIIHLQLDEMDPAEDGITDMMSHVKITLIAGDDKIKASSLEWEDR